MVAMQNKLLNGYNRMDLWKVSLTAMIHGMIGS